MNIHIVKKERCVTWTTYILFHIFNCFFSFYFSLIFTSSCRFHSFFLNPFLSLISSFFYIPSLTSSPLPIPHFIHPSPHPPLLFLLLNLEKKSACTLHECLENGCIFDYLVFGIIFVVYFTNKPS